MMTPDLQSSTFQASPIQHRLWERRAAGWPAPYVQCRLGLPGPVDRDALGAAVDRLVARYEILRTTLASLPGGGVAQVVHDTGPALREATAADDAALAGLAVAERTDLDAAAEPVRFLLVTGPDDRATLLLTAHGAVADRASMRVLARELGRVYRDPAVAEPSELPLAYADFAAWHHDLLTNVDGAQERRAWTGYLTELRQLPAAFAGGQPGDATVVRRLDPALLRALDDFAAAHSVSGRQVLAGVFALTCWRYQGDRDAVVELVDPARGYDAVREAVGPFERAVPVLYPIDPDRPLAELVRGFDTVAVDWADRVDYLDPGQEITGWYGFGYVEGNPGDESFPDAVEESAGSGPVQLECVRSGERLDLVLRHSTAALPAPAAEAFVECFEVLLREGLARPEAPVGDLAPLSAQQRERLLARGRGPERAGPLPAVHEAFAEQAARVPDAVAVVEGAAEMSYADLDSRANQLANFLRSVGVSAGDKVVISLDRSVELVVAILGVLKAGAAFVPVDPAHPRDRLTYVLSDTGASVLLCTAQRRAGLWVATRVLVPEENWAQVADQPTTAPQVDTAPADPAYVLYTSGTTGNPNGVVVAHGGLANYLAWCVDAYDLAGGTGALTHSSISFDFTLTTLLGPLLAGQRVILLRESGNVAGIAAALRGHRDLSLVKLTPTHLDVLSQLLNPADLAGAVRSLVVGGEALDARAVALFRAAGTQIVNEYGPTETVVGSTAYVVNESTVDSGPVPIGRPIANTQVYLVGARGGLVPDGAVGELCIAGAGVGVGYLHREELTARRFVPALDSPDQRMYRTGDLARWRPDGDLDYLGRIDEQIKIHGVRVEPAEIEAVLLEVDGVAQAVVVVRQDEDPGRSSPLAKVSTLVAYVVPARDGVAVSLAALAAHCRTHLPEQLVPRAFVTLDALPLTVNGKLNRAALPKPDLSPRSAADFVAPRTEVEEILAGSIATVLGLESVGIDDNYFVMGGDSIRSVMVASRAQARGIEVTVADLHTQPTVRRVAAHLADRVQETRPPATEPFSLISAEDRARVPENVEDAFPLNLLQEGMIFHRDFAAKSAVYHAIASIRLKAPYDHDVMWMVINQLVERHPMLRTSFDMTTFSHPMELVHTDFACPLLLEDLRGFEVDRREESVRAWIDSEKARGFELHEYPLIRFMVQRLSDEEWQFTYGFHHEIVDGWSEALMIAELFSHYFSIIYDEPISIKPPTSTMRDAVALELEALQDKKNFEFWARYLADATMMRLPRFGAAAQGRQGRPGHRAGRGTGLG